jgi:hypothetical protein
MKTIAADGFIQFGSLECSSVVFATEIELHAAFGFLRRQLQAHNSDLRGRYCIGHPPTRSDDLSMDGRNPTIASLG